jgi:hypothetical protein
MLPYLTMPIVPLIVFVLLLDIQIIVAIGKCR